MGDEFDSGLEPPDFGPGDGAGSSRKPRKEGLKETARRLRGEGGGRVGHRAGVEWRHDSRRVCEAGGEVPDAPRVEELKEVLLKSRTGESLLEAGADVKIIYDAQNPASQYYPAARVITLNPRRTKGDLLDLLTRELRRAWQGSHGALVNPLSFEPDEAILVNRAQAADALMISVRVAWELKLGGEQEMWNHLAGSPAGDVGRAFEVHAREDFRTLNNGAAARAAYDRFFDDSRTKAHDKRLIHQMLLDENGGLRRAEGKPPKISVDLFKKMGEMPQGRNYLLMKGARAPTDAGYAAVEDRSNANFLWFIKFERSFHEKELRMLEESVRLSAEIIDFAKWSARGRGDAGGAGL